MLSILISFGFVVIVHHLNMFSAILFQIKIKKIRTVNTFSCSKVPCMFPLYPTSQLHILCKFILGVCSKKNLLVLKLGGGGHSVLIEMYVVWIVLLVLFVFCHCQCVVATRKKNFFGTRNLPIGINENLASFFVLNAKITC